MFFQKSVQIQFHFALVAFYDTPEKFVAASGTDIAGLLVLNPLFGTLLPPIRDSAENDLFAHGHGEIVNVPARKFIALVTTCVTLFFGAIPDFALLAMHEKLAGHAAVAFDILGCKIFAIGKRALALDISLIKIHQGFLEFFVIITMRDMDGAYTAIKTTRRYIIRIDFHDSCPPV